MQTVLAALALSAIPLLACPNAEETMRKYIEENYPTQEGKPSNVQFHTQRLNPNVSMAQLSVPAEGEEKNAPPQLSVLFLTGASQCEISMQVDGEYTEILDVATTKYVFVRTEDSTPDERHTNFQIITVRAGGGVTNTHDQGGGEIYFSETIQNRCEGTVGEVTHLTRDKNDRNRITLRQQHIDRDGKCRVTEDASTYRYYRLTPEHWQLDDGEDDSERSQVSQKSR